MDQYLKKSQPNMEKINNNWNAVSNCGGGYDVHAKTHHI
jgi:hypothetical protein